MVIYPQNNNYFRQHKKKADRFQEMYGTVGEEPVKIVHDDDKAGGIR